MIKKQDIKSFKKIIKKVKVGYKDYNETKRGDSAVYYTFSSIRDIKIKKNKIIVDIIELDDTGYDTPQGGDKPVQSTFEMKV